jgi:hypothetical protein
MNKTETLLLEFVGAYEKSYQDYRDKTVFFEIAREALSRATMITRCTVVGSREANDFYFDSKLRNTLTGVVEKWRNGQVIATSTSTTYSGYFKEFKAFELLNRENQLSLLKLLESNQGRLAIADSRLLFVVEDFGAVDVQSGKYLAAPVIFLKEYLQSTSRLDQFEAALKKLDPRAAEKFSLIATLNNHPSNDHQWLAELSETLETHSGKISSFIKEAFPPDRLQAVNFIQNHQFYLNYYDFELRKKVTEFDKTIQTSELKSLHEAFFKMGPREHIDNAHLALCP